MSADVDLYGRLESLSKILESSGRIDEFEHKDAYGTLLDAMTFVQADDNTLRAALRECLEQAVTWLEEARGCKPEDLMDYNGWAHRARALTGDDEP